MRKWTKKLSRLTNANAVGGAIYGDVLEAVYLRKEFTDPTHPRYPLVKWFCETESQTRRRIAPEYRAGLAVQISAIHVYRNLYFEAYPGAPKLDRNAVATYGNPRLLFMTELGIASRFLRFEEVAHSLCYNCPFEKLRASESWGLEQEARWWIRKAKQQQLDKGETIPQPLRCHLAIYEAFLRWSAELHGVRSSDFQKARKKALMARDGIKAEGCLDKANSGSCACYHPHLQGVPDGR
jgi:hypothetical protein